MPPASAPHRRTTGPPAPTPGSSTQDAACSGHCPAPWCNAKRPPSSRRRPRGGPYHWGRSHSSRCGKNPLSGRSNRREGLHREHSWCLEPAWHSGKREWDATFCRPQRADWGRRSQDAEAASGSTRSRRSVSAPRRKRGRHRLGARRPPLGFPFSSQRRTCTIPVQCSSYEMPALSFSARASSFHAQPPPSCRRAHGRRRLSRH